MGTSEGILLPDFQIENLTPDQINATVAVAVAIGTLYCFLGYRTLKFVIGLTGFLLAGSGAALLAGWLSEGHMIAMLIAGGIGGIAGALALFFLYHAGVFCLGFVGACLVAQNVVAELPQVWWTPLVVIGLGVAGGLMALLLERPAVTAATAAIGAWIVVSGVASLVLGTNWLEARSGSPEFQANHRVILACWTVLALAGLMAQLATHKKAPPEPSK